MEYLAAAQLDALNGANWQRSGGKGTKPKAIPRPGAATKEQPFKDRQLGGKTSLSLEEMAAFQRRWVAGEHKSSGRKRKPRKVR